jgi:predicted dehydrogenase
LARSAAAAASLWAAPYVVPATAFGRTAPSNRVNLAMIGAGNQSTVDLPSFLALDDVQVVAVCDVNRASFGYRSPEQFLGREPVRDQINAYYAKKSPAGQYRGCDAYVDFRELLARPDVDAVEIVVPDHWHAVMTVLACRAGKDIYCQKPLSLCIREGQEMVRAVRKHDRILQTGSQYRSSALVRHACELVRNGRIGTLRKITTLVAENNFTGPGPGWKPMPVPEGFDYPRWLGPAPQAAYHKDRCLYRFRFILDYSGGQTTNFGAHSNDIAQWAMGADATGPIEVEDLGAEFPPKGSLFTTATKVHFRARYANGVELVCRTGAPGFGARLEGTEGWIQVGYKFDSSPASLATAKIGPGEIRLPVSNDHYRNFIDAVKAHRDPISPVEMGHRTASVCHLGNIAMQLHRKLRWDPAGEVFLDDTDANRLLSRGRRDPWKLS